MQFCCEIFFTFFDSIKMFQCSEPRKNVKYIANHKFCSLFHVIAVLNKLFTHFISLYSSFWFFLGWKKPAKHKYYSKKEFEIFFVLYSSFDIHLVFQCYRVSNVSSLSSSKISICIYNGTLHGDKPFSLRVFKMVFVFYFSFDLMPERLFSVKSTLL